MYGGGWQIKYRKGEFNMRKIKYVIFLAIMSCILFLFNIRVYATDNQLDDIMNSIPNTIEINDSKLENIEEKINEIQIPEEYEIKILSTDNYWSVLIGIKKKDQDAYLQQKAISVEHTCDLIEKILEIIPENINIDIPEIEYDNYGNSNELLGNEIKKILKVNKIEQEDLEKNNIEVHSFIHPLYLKNGVKSAEIYIEYNGRNVSKSNKNINVVYNNTKQFNKQDEEYIKKLKITSNKYYEVGLNYLKSDYSNLWKEIAEEYEKQIDDKEVKIKVEIGAAGPEGYLNLGVDGNILYVGIFKNDILYDIRRLEIKLFIPVINVPSTINEEGINEYIINEIKKYYPDFGKNIYEISKGTGDLSIDDGYTVKSSAGLDSYIIVRKNTKITLIDEDTKIKIETTVDSIPEDTELVVKQVMDEKELKNIKKMLEEKIVKFKGYNISLIRNNVEIQPNGNVKVSLPVSDLNSDKNLVVCGIDGEKIQEYSVEINDGFAIFITNNFMTYVLGERKEENNVEQKEENNIENTEEKIEHKLDNTPKTGNNEIIVTMSLILTVLSTSGIIIIKRMK